MKSVAYTLDIGLAGICSEIRVKHTVDFLDFFLPLFDEILQDMRVVLNDEEGT